MMQNQYIADFSLALINRTGAYHVCRQVVEGLPHFFPAVRYWRLVLKREPRGLLRKLLGRAMLFDITRRRAASPEPRHGLRRSLDLATVFFDPLYVLGAALERRDMVLCHDIGPVSHAELFDAGTTALYRQAYGLIQEARPGMVFVSEASRAAFVSRFGDDYRFLRVIPLYVRPAVEGGAEQAPPGVRPPFLLSVGAMEIRKNYHRCIPAFAASGLHERGYDYALCGPRANNSREIEALARATPGVRAFGYVTDAELRWLYRHAAGFVLPSLLEGFGVPALEAAQNGLVSLVSREGAQREAVGEGAILVDPGSVTAIAEGMRQLIDMPETERLERLRLSRAHAEALSQERYLARWSALLAAG